MSEKGIALIKALIITAIISIIISLVIPKITKSFDVTKKETFLIEVDKIYKETQTEINTAALRNQHFTGANSIKGPKLNLSIENIDYCVEVKDDIITSIKVYDDEYYIEINSTYDSFKKNITIDDIKEHSKTYICD